MFVCVCVFGVMTTLYNIIKAHYQVKAENRHLLKGMWPPHTHTQSGFIACVSVFYGWTVFNYLLRSFTGHSSVDY